MTQRKARTSAINAALNLDGDSDRISRFYRQWASNYNADLEAEGYSAPAIMAKLVKAYLPAQPIIEFLDAGCGTGLLAGTVNSLLEDAPGQLVFDGFDLSEDMVREASRLGLYRDLKAPVDLNEPISNFDETLYDVVMSCGVFTLGHVPPESLINLISLARPGGTVVVSTRASYYEETDYQQVSDQFVSEGCLSLLQQGDNLPYTAEETAHYWVYQRM